MSRPIDAHVHQLTAYFVSQPARMSWVTVTLAQSLTKDVYTGPAAILCCIRNVTLMHQPYGAVNMLHSMHAL